MSALELNTGLFWCGHGALSEPRVTDNIDEAGPVDGVSLEEAGHQLLKSFREVEARICFLVGLPEQIGAIVIDVLVERVLGCGNLKGRVSEDEAEEDDAEGE